jgi:hypothetical protein
MSEFGRLRYIHSRPSQSYFSSAQVSKEKISPQLDYVQLSPIVETIEGDDENLHPANLTSQFPKSRNATGHLPNRQPPDGRSPNTATRTQACGGGGGGLQSVTTHHPGSQSFSIRCALPLNKVGWQSCPAAIRPSSDFHVSLTNGSDKVWTWNIVFELGYTTGVFELWASTELRSN